MKHLIVYAHPNTASFNHAIKETLVRVLKEKGQDIRVRDLYALHFDPVLKADDFQAFLAGKVPGDIAIEQDHVRWADQITFLYPIWWSRMPSILGGYLDRVFSKGFAYDYTATGPVGLLPGKKVFIINTLGAPLEVLQSSGVIKSMDQIMDNETFRFCAMEMVGHKYFGSVPTVTDADRKKMLEEIAAIAASWPVK
ncbi:MAG: NAD(P)H-dependent oxidoreductase [Candidatus Omnitrophica bacterium]|nr:NAD(P)H-dependent oxidoreductase [Candidatus Omnitrophota bacterium]